MTYVDTLREAMGDEQGRLFEKLIHYLDLDPNSPNLALAAAVAPLIIDLGDTTERVTEAASAVEDLPERLKSAFETALKTIDERCEVIITTKVAAAMDIMQGEIRAMCRDVAVSEFSAAATLRSAAIQQEVGAIRRAAEDLAANRAAGLPSSSSGSVSATSWKPYVYYPSAFLAGVFLADLLFKLHH